MSEGCYINTRPFSFPEAVLLNQDLWALGPSHKNVIRSGEIWFDEHTDQKLLRDLASIEGLQHLVLTVEVGD